MFLSPNGVDVHLHSKWMDRTIEEILDQEKTKHQQGKQQIQKDFFLSLSHNIDNNYLHKLYLV